jgi:ATP-dependent DNA helicase RecG
MKLRTLELLVFEGESDGLEFKKSTGGLKGGMESLCGFLNGRGGQVLFGVTDAGKIVGQDISDHTLQVLASEIAHLDPPTLIEQIRIGADRREVLMLATTDLSGTPHTYRGRAYQRVGTTTSIMPREEYERRLLERGHSQKRWENLPASGYTPADLDQDEIRRTISEAVDAGRLNADITGPGETLRKLHLIDGERVNQAGIVAFASEVLPGYPQCSMRLARFRGITKDEFLDQNQLSGNAFALLHEATVFIRRNLPVRGRFEDGVLERKDEPIYPPMALREALVNALCHRDYSVAGGAVSVAIFDDRLEICSTGSLPFGLTVNDLKGEHTSRPRNPLLAEVFYRRGLVERWGRGTNKIIDLCRAAGQPAVEFEERSGEVVVRFRPSGYSPPHRVNHDLTERQRRILHILSGKQCWRSSEIMKKLPEPVSRGTLLNDLRMLRDLRLVGYDGRGQSARWRLILPNSE